ncbi:MAG: hypothetical protein KAG93_04870 [Desulfuromusa sp.]|nr:hypothetical protein [Desulfuromusa sp.]
MTYFTQTSHETLVGRDHRQAESGEYLLISHTETPGDKQSFHFYLIPAHCQKGTL